MSDLSDSVVVYGYLPPAQSFSIVYIYMCGAIIDVILNPPTVICRNPARSSEIADLIDGQYSAAA